MVLKTQILKGVPGLDLDPSSGSGLAIVQLPFWTLDQLGVRMQHLGQELQPGWRIAGTRTATQHSTCEPNPHGSRQITAHRPNLVHTLFLHGSQVKHTFYIFKWLGKKIKWRIFCDMCKLYHIQISSSVNNVYWLRASLICLRVVMAAFVRQWQSWELWQILPKIFTIQPFRENVYQLLPYPELPSSAFHGSLPTPHVLSCVLFLQLLSWKKQNPHKSSRYMGSTQRDAWYLARC